VPYVMVEKIAYGNTAPWPVAADGSGASLQRLSLLSYANEPTNWFAASPTAGFPNRPNRVPSVTLLSPPDGATIRLPQAVELSASATDPDGAIRSVAFVASGQVIAILSNAPYVFTWTNPAPGWHSLEVIATDDRLGTARSGAARIHVLTAPPQVSITAPHEATTQLAGEGVSLTATASSSSGIIDRVDFFAGSQPIGRAEGPPYSLFWTPAGTGTFKVTAVATDTWGVAGTSAPVTVAFVTGTNIPVNLCPAGALWKYLDDGSNQGTYWKEPDFADGTWKSGAAELGYGERAEGRPEATELAFGTNANRKHITYYFRREFTAAAPSLLKHPELRLLRDDGAIVYLNGVEVFRSNMPEGAVNYLTLASNTVSGIEETTWFTNTIKTSDLREGRNVLAVELHQAAANSSDLSFDLALDARRILLAPSILEEPASVEAELNASASFSVVAGGTAPLSYQWSLNGTPLPGATAHSLFIQSVSVTNTGEYTVAVRNALGSATSAAATLKLKVDGPHTNSLTIAIVPGGFKLDYVGKAGAAWELQRSVDLTNWVGLSSGTVPPDGKITFTDYAPPASAAYYRALQR